jgi:DNA-binding GntR family transcriptional regulator
LPESGTSVKRLPAKLVRQTVVDQVLKELRARILSGSFAPGAPLRQEALAEELGVSRIPIREAMRMLGAEGLVDLLPHRGAYVSMLSLDEVREFFDLRLRLEPWLFGEAALRITPAELQEAEALVEQMNHAGAEDWAHLNWRLHEMLYEPAGRPLALNMVRALHEKSERYLRFQIVNTPVRRQTRDEHTAMIALCRKRKADKAIAAMQEHIADAGAQIVELIGRLLNEAKVQRSS